LKQKAFNWLISLGVVVFIGMSGAFISGEADNIYYDDVSSYATITAYEIPARLPRDIQPEKPWKK